MDEIIRVNPYDFRADVKDQRLFAGRKSEITQIREEIAGLALGSSASPVVALIGERRVGKTSLLHRTAEAAIEYNILPCSISITNFLATAAGEFWHEVFQRLLSVAADAGVITFESNHEAIGFKPIRSEPKQQVETQAPALSLFQWYAHRAQFGGPIIPPTGIISHDLKMLCDVIAGRYRGVLLILDEAHLLVQSLDIIQQLRQVLRASSRCGIVCAGESGLTQMFTDPSAPFYLQANIIPVGNFVRQADITECALLPLAENERPLVSPMTIDHLARLSHGKPNQIRLICHSIYRRYVKNEQKDLNITIEALDDILDNIQALYESEYNLKQRVDSIKRLSSIDLEVLYLITRYPSWRPQDIVVLDEAFRGDKTSARAIDRRNRWLKKKWKAFVALGLLEENTDRYLLTGGEFLQLYLRFFYEVRKYGTLSRQLKVGEGLATPFGEKAEKLVRSLGWELQRPPSMVVTTVRANEGSANVISEVRQRFTMLESIVRGEPIDLVAKSQALMESLYVCQLVVRHAQYYLLVIVVRNLENPRESLLLEIFFETREVLVFPRNLLTEQAQAAGILVLQL